MYYVLVDVYQEVPVGSVRVGVCAYFLFFTMDTARASAQGLVRVGVYYLIIYIIYYLYKLIYMVLFAITLREKTFINIGGVGGSATPGCAAERIENLEKCPHRRILTASPTKNRRKSRI